MKERLSNSAPIDPHTWEKFKANLVGANNHGILREQDYWVCSKCRLVSLNPPDWAIWDDCKENG